MANQAATSEFRKLKTKPLLNRKTNLDSDIIANFGLVGQLSSSKDGHPTPNESIPYPTPQVMNSKPTVEVDSTPVPSWPKSTYLSRMRGSTIEPDAMVVVVPPALSYTSSGHIVPYHSAIPTTNVVEAGYRQQQEATTANKATAHSSTTQTSTPGAVFDMLINQMMTPEGQRAARLENSSQEITLPDRKGEAVGNEAREELREGGHQARRTTVEEEDESPIDLFPRWEPRPY